MNDELDWGGFVVVPEKLCEIMKNAATWSALGDHCWIAVEAADNVDPRMESEAEGRSTHSTYLIVWLFVLLFRDELL